MGREKGITETLSTAYFTTQEELPPSLQTAGHTCMCAHTHTHTITHTHRVPSTVMITGCHLCLCAVTAAAAAAAAEPHRDSPVSQTITHLKRVFNVICVC